MKQRNIILKISAVVLCILKAFLYIGVTFLIEKLINVTTEKDSSSFGILLILAVVFTAVFLGVSCLFMILKNKYVNKEMVDYKSNLFSTLFKNSLRDFYRYEIGDYVNSVGTDVNTIRKENLLALFNFVEQISILLFGIAAAVYMSYQLAIASVFAMLVPLVVSLMFSNKISVMQKKVSDDNASFTSCVKDILSGFSTVKNFKVETEIVKRFNKRNQIVEDANKSYNNLIDFVGTLGEVSNIIVIIVILFVGSILTLNGVIEVGTIFAYITLIQSVLYPINALALTYNLRRASRKLKEKAQEMVSPSKQPASGLQPFSRFNSVISLRNVSYSYDGISFSLKDINLAIKKGKKYAVVGMSGCGKTTLINILKKAYDNFEGSIDVDGIDLKNIATENWSEIMSIVEQNVFVFNDTIMFNITLNASFPEKDINKAIVSTGLDELLQAKGEDYMCGENGNRLSGGEKQRISVARSIIRNPDILLFDEGTSALDNVHAANIEKMILSLEGVTTLVVTHKFTAQSLAAFDEIIMMKNGTIVETGTFEQLMERRGDFYMMFNTLT